LFLHHEEFISVHRLNQKLLGHPDLRCMIALADHRWRKLCSTLANQAAIVLMPPSFFPTGMLFAEIDDFLHNTEHERAEQREQVESGVVFIDPEGGRLWFRPVDLKRHLKDRGVASASTNWNLLLQPLREQGILLEESWQLRGRDVEVWSLPVQRVYGGNAPEEALESEPF
jgi:hypothetical protein